MVKIARSVFISWSFEPEEMGGGSFNFGKQKLINSHNHVF